MISTTRNLIITFGFIFSLVNSSIAQQKIDSLVIALDTLEGNCRVDALINISNYYGVVDAKVAIEYSTLAISEAREQNYTEGIQKGLHNLAVANDFQHDFEKALKYYRESIEYIDTSKGLLSLIKIYNNIGTIYDELDYSDKALEYFQKNLKLLERFEDDGMFVMTCINIAINHARKNEYDSSLVHLNEAYRIASQDSFIDKNLRALIKVNIAEVYILTEKFELAEKAAKEALMDENYHDDKYTKSNIYLVLGRVYYSLKKYSESESALRKALKLAKELGSPNLEMEARRNLTETYKAWGQNRLALQEFEKYDELKDSTLSADNNKQILEIEAKYESEKQKKEIELLKKETALAESSLAQSRMKNNFFASIAVLAIIIFVFIYIAYRYKNKSNIALSKINDYLTTSEEQLLELNSIKDNLIRIIGHDLKGPLGSVMGFSELLTSNKYDKEQTEKFLNIIFNTSRGVNQLLDNILHWAKLQSGGYDLNKDIFNVKETIMRGVDPYLGIAENKNIKVELKLADDLAAFGDAFTCSIVLGNLVNNALKYSYNDSKVILKVEQIEEEVLFSVIDYGVGIDKEACESLFDNHIFNSTLGTNNEKGTGFGLKICKQFIELNGGKIWTECEKDKGSSFHFTMPVN